MICNQVAVSESSVYLGCIINEKRGAVISYRQGEEFFRKELGWNGQSLILDLLHSATTRQLMASGRFKLDKQEMRGAIVSLDGETGNPKSFLITKQEEEITQSYINIMVELYSFPANRTVILAAAI